MDCPPKKSCCREVAVVERWPFNSGGSTVMKNDCCINIFLIQYIKKKQMGKKATGRRKTVHVYSMAKELKLGSDSETQML